MRISYADAVATKTSSVPVFTNGLYVTPGLAASAAGQQMANSLAKLLPAQQLLAVKQIVGLSLVQNAQSGLTLGSLSASVVNQRLAALSSRLAITDGKTAIERAELNGNPLDAAQSSLSLANQSREAGVAGTWVSLTNNTPSSGTNMTAASTNLQVGQDFAVTRDLVVGVAAASSGLQRSQGGETPFYLTGTLISGNAYLAYSPERLRITAQAGAQSGKVENHRYITTNRIDTNVGQTSIRGGAFEAQFGYELGETTSPSGAKASSGFSLIPSIAIGYRGQISASYKERSTAEYLALAVPGYAQNQTYGALGVEARAVVYFNDIAAMPRASVGIERNNGRLSQLGAIALAIDPTAEFATNLGNRSHNTVTRYSLGIDLIGTGASGFALRADYSGSYSTSEQVSGLTVGMKLDF